MQESKAIRKYIRHPSDIPIEVSSDWTELDFGESSEQTLTNVSLGGLAFVCQNPLHLLDRVRVCIPILKRDNFLVGKVVWCNKSGDDYDIGVEFESSKDVFRLRMIEQICHIEHYRKEVARAEGRELSTQEAASEWISRYADSFPAL